MDDSTSACHKSVQSARYQAQTSQQTLAQGLEEYYATNPHLKRGAQLSNEARDFFLSHDIVHVVYGCGVSMPHEAVVKLASLFGTTGGLSIIRGYLLHESIDIYRKLPLGDTLIALTVAPYLVVRTIWRCARQRARWPWTRHESFMDLPLSEIRDRFRIKVFHTTGHRQAS